MNRTLKSLGSILIVLSLSSAYVPAETPAKAPVWMDTDVISAAEAIQMTELQLRQFREAVSVFLNDYTSLINEEEEPDALEYQREVPTLDDLTKKLDERMALFLTEKQIPSYQAYRSTLLVRLEARRNDQ